MVKVSIIVPVKDDKRISNLIRALERQTFKNFEVLIADDSKERLFNEKTKLDLKYFHKIPMSIADKFHFLGKKAKADIIAVTESDCVPSERWLEELLSEYENDKTIVVGAQVTSENINYGNLLIPKKAFKISHDNILKIADDTDWFLTLTEKGFVLKSINKAVVRHYKNPVKRLLRSFTYGREHAYVYIKHRKDRKLLNSIFFQSASSFFSLFTVILLIMYGIYYKIKFMMKK